MSEVLPIEKSNPEYDAILIQKNNVFIPSFFKIMPNMILTGKFTESNIKDRFNPDEKSLTCINTVINQIALIKLIIAVFVAMIVSFEYQVIPKLFTLPIIYKLYGLLLVFVLVVPETYLLRNKIIKHFTEFKFKGFYTYSNYVKFENFFFSILVCKNSKDFENFNQMKNELIKIKGKYNLNPFVDDIFQSVISALLIIWSVLDETTRIYLVIYLFWTIFVIGFYKVFIYKIVNTINARKISKTLMKYQN